MQVMCRFIQLALYGPLFCKGSSGRVDFSVIRPLPDCLTARLIKTLGRGTWVIKMKSNSHSPPSVCPSVRPSSSCSTRSLCTRFIIKLELYYFNKTPRDPFCPVLTGLLAHPPCPPFLFPCLSLCFVAFAVAIILRLRSRPICLKTY